MSRDYIGYIKIKKTMFNFYFGGKLSSVTPRSLRRLHWMLIPGPTTSILGGSQFPVGPGISQRAAAARTQTVWRWLVRFHRESERVRS